MKSLPRRIGIAGLTALGTLLVGCAPSPKQLSENLVVAVRGKAPEKVKALLNAGADPTIVMEGNESAVDIAAMEVNRTNDVGKLALDASDKEEQILFLITSNVRHRRPAVQLEGTISINAEYRGVNLPMEAHIMVHDNNGNHELLLSSFETTTKNINRSSLDQIRRVFPITMGDRYKVSCTQYENEGCEVDYIEHLDADTKPTISVPVTVFLPSTDHILNSAKAGTKAG